MFFARPGAGREVRCGSPAGSELAPTEAAAETQAQPVNGGNRIDIAPIVRDKAKEKAEHRTQSASRLSLVGGGNRIDVSPNRERRGKRKGWAQDAKCVQAQPGGFALQKRYSMKMRTSDPEKIRFYR